MHLGLLIAVPAFHDLPAWHNDHSFVHYDLFIGVTNLRLALIVGCAGLLTLVVAGFVRGGVVGSGLVVIGLFSGMLCVTFITLYIQVAFVISLHITFILTWWWPTIPLSIWHVFLCVDLSQLLLELLGSDSTCGEGIFDHSVLEFVAGSPFLNLTLDPLLFFTLLSFFFPAYGLWHQHLPYPLQPLWLSFGVKQVSCQSDEPIDVIIGCCFCSYSCIVVVILCPTCQHSRWHGKPQLFHLPRLSQTFAPTLQCPWC